jgi:plasmid stabilization system protein ParE
LVYRLTRAAERQIDEILLECARTLGIDAAGRYGLLLLTIMAALGDDPALFGSVEVPRLNGIRAYAVRLGRRRVAVAYRVREPRHLIIYRVGSDGIVEVPGLAHDRMVLSRAARRAAKGANQ